MGMANRARLSYPAATMGDMRISPGFDPTHVTEKLREVAQPDHPIGGSLKGVPPNDLANTYVEGTDEQGPTVFGRAPKSSRTPV